MRLISNLKFTVDNNVGKLTEWLRIVGYDTLFFKGGDDSQMIATALAEGRVILTRDTQFMIRRVVTNGQLKAILIKSDQPEPQMHQVIDTLNLACQFRPFTIYMECNQPLLERNTLAGNDQKIGEIHQRLTTVQDIVTLPVMSVTTMVLA